MLDTPLVLASGSPRRHELLRRIVPSFAIVTSEAEEKGSTRQLPEPLPPLDLPAEFAIPLTADPRLWAYRKVMEVVELYQAELKAGTLILGADTVVAGPGQVLNKPKDKEDAAGMLRLLRGREHYVVTGYALSRVESSDTLHIGATVSRVIMRDYTDSELKGYVATGESLDKAGAYALQGLGGALVQRVEGCATNVVGLPLCAVRAILAAYEIEVLPYPQNGYCGYCLR